MVAPGLVAVARIGDGSVDFYAADAARGAQPIAHLEPWAPSGYVLGNIAFDARAALYAASPLLGPGAPSAPVARIDVFAPGSYGAMPPVRTIAGPHTHLGRPLSMAVDAQGLLYVANTGVLDNAPLSAVEVFAPDANGDVAPVREILFDVPSVPSGLALDTNGDLFVGDQEGGGTDPALRVFPQAANGRTSPLRALTIDPPPHSNVAGVALSPSGLAYVVDWTQDDVAMLDKSGQSPAVFLKGDQTTLKTPTDIAVAPSGRVYVMSANDRLLMFDASARGNVAPLGSFVVPAGYFLAIVP
jgi:hypothetical protein